MSTDEFMSIVTICTTAVAALIVINAFKEM